MKRLLPAPLLSACLVVLWLLLNRSLSPGHLLTAVVLAWAIPLLTLGLRPLPVRIRRPGTIVRLGLRVMADSLHSNYMVLRFILRPKLRRHPAAFVHIPLQLRDPNGLAVRLQLTQKRDVQMQSAEYNTWDRKGRINQASPAYERAQPIEVGHVVFFVKDVQACERFYVENFGFAASDRYPERGAFLRTAPDGGHHDIFLLQRPDKHAGLNHVAFTVRDIHEVFGGGMHISRCGWDTQLGPGRHPVSSAYFWYFKNPAGALVEYYADEDQLTAEWQPREFEPGPTVFAEWAIDGGLDGNTRRQKGAGAADGKFLTDKK